MYDDINATKRVTLGRLSMLGAAIALRVVARVDAGRRRAGEGRA